MQAGPRAVHGTAGSSAPSSSKSAAGRVPSAPVERSNAPGQHAHQELEMVDTVSDQSSSQVGKNSQHVHEQQRYHQIGHLSGLHDANHDLPQPSWGPRSIRTRASPWGVGKGGKGGGMLLLRGEDAPWCHCCGSNRACTGARHLLNLRQAAAGCELVAACWASPNAWRHAWYHQQATQIRRCTNGKASWQTSQS